MENIVEWWQQMPAAEQSALIKIGLVLIASVIVLVKLLSIRKNIQTVLANEGIDQILVIPGIKQEGNRKPAWLSLSLSWLIVITLGLLIFDFFWKPSLPNHFFIKNLLFKLWMLTVFFVGFLFLLRKCILALANFLNQAQIKKKLQLVLALDDEKSDARHDSPDAVAALIDAVSVGLYCIPTLILGILLIAAAADLQIIGGLMAGLLSGLGRLSVALLMVGMGFAAIRYIYAKSAESSEKTLIHLSSLCLIGCILLAVTLLGDNTASLFWPLLIILLLFAAAAVTAMDAPFNMADMLAGLYLRASGAGDRRLSGEFEGYRLAKIGWKTSHIANDNGEKRELKNSDILAFVNKDASQNGNELSK